MVILATAATVGVCLSNISFRNKLKTLLILVVILAVLAQTDPDVKVSLFLTSYLKIDILKLIFEDSVVKTVVVLAELLLYLRY